MDLKIFICTHKKFIFNKAKYFIPLLCGADFNEDIGEKKIIQGIIFLLKIKIIQSLLDCIGYGKILIINM